MRFLELDSSCGEGQWLCDATYEWTGSRALANLADLLVGKSAAVLGLIVFGLALRWILHRLIDRLVTRASTGVLPDRVVRMPLQGRGETTTSAPPDRAGASRRVQRATTMGTLLKSVVTGIVAAITVTMILAAFGVNVAPIIASAGIIGVAVGFGAQSLVTDFLSGVFMIFEDQYGVGDVVDLGEASGTVEAVSLRVTRLRAVDGTVWYVRNGEIVRVGNQSQNWARSVLDIGVAYDEDLVRVQNVLKEVAHSLWEDEDFKNVVIEEPEVWGVEQLAADGVVVRVVLKTAPLEQWRVAREMRQRIKSRFDHEGIEIPFPQRVVWHRDDSAAARDADEAPAADA